MDGTTDVTRTFSYGQPTDFMKEAYTRVLAGAIDLARATFPEGTPETRLDILARWNLMRVGLDYNHGTGHGIGAYGPVHESPVQLRIYKEEEHPMRQVRAIKRFRIWLCICSDDSEGLSRSDVTLGLLLIRVVSQ